MKTPNMICPKCNGLYPCKADENFLKTQEFDYKNRARVFEGYNWFMRGRTCEGCGHSFVTAEIEEETILRLIREEKKLAKLEDRNTELLLDLRSITDDKGIKNLLGHLDGLRRLREIHFSSNQSDPKSE